MYCNDDIYQHYWYCHRDLVSMPIAYSILENDVDTMDLQLAEENCGFGFRTSLALTPPSAAGARPPAGGSLRSPITPAARCVRPYLKNHRKIGKIFSKKFFLSKKKSETLKNPKEI